MKLIKIKKIEFDYPLRIITHPNGMDSEEIEYIHRFYLTTPNIFSSDHYICFYCFKKDFIKANKLEDKVLKTIIEGEMSKMEVGKFYGEDASSYMYDRNIPTFGCVDNLYTLIGFTGKQREDEYFFDSHVINEFYHFKPRTLRYITFDSGRLFFWRNFENIKIVLPEFPYNLLHKK